MILLAIDTSAIASAAILRWHEDEPEAAVLAEFATEDTRSHAEVLAPRFGRSSQNRSSRGPAWTASSWASAPGRSRASAPA